MVQACYLTLLISHVCYIAVTVRFCHDRASKGLKRDDIKHKKIVKYAYPIWLYVSVTGVMIYLLLYQIFPQQV